MTRYQWLKNMREGAAVKRFHTMRMEAQTVADHSHGVILALLAVGCGGQDLLVAAALHDVAELVTGDVPAPAKWKSPSLLDALAAMEADFHAEHGIDYNLTEEEKIALNWADAYDLAIKCLEEIQRGNRHVDAMFERIYPRCMERVQAFDAHLGPGESRFHEWAQAMRDMNARLAEDYTAFSGREDWWR